MLFLAEHPSPHGRRMHGQRFHAAEAGRPAGVPQPADEGVGGLETAGEFEREHPAETAHLAGGQRVLRVGRQARVVHPGHGRVALAAPRRAPGRCRCAGPRAAAGCAGRAAAARRRTGRAPRRSAGRRPRSGPGARAGPASTPADTSEWPLRYLVALCQTRSMPKSVGRWLSGVAKVLSARVSTSCARARSATARRSVTCSERVARRLHQDQPGPRGQRLLERLRVGLVDLGSRHAEPGQQVQQHRRRAPVGGLLPDDVVTGGHQGQHRRW